MNHNDTTAVATSAEIIATLRELIDALDRRLAQSSELAKPGSPPTRRRSGTKR